MNELFEKAKQSGIEIPKITSEEIDKAIEPVLRKMEKAGIRIDVPFFHSLEEKISAEISKLEKKIYAAAGEEFNINSPSQLAEVLFTKMKLPTTGLKKSQTGFSTAASELKKIEDKHKIIPLILEYRELAKLVSTYLKPLPILVDENDRLHTTYGLETSTGRINSSEPNLQNIPIKGRYGNEIRRAFIASEGHKLVVADYSQIELRVVACLAQDEAMMKAFRDGDDIHAQTAAQIFGIKPSEVMADHRRKAKAVNFGIIYGQTPYGLSQALDISVEEAGKYIRNYFEVYKGIAKYMSATIESAHQAGYVETLFGTRRHLPNLSSPMRFLAEAEERMAINTPIQGTAAEILKLAMIEIDKKLSSFNDQFPIKSQLKNDQINDNYKMENGKCSRMLLTVHDELVVEVPSDQAEEISRIVKETMERVVEFPVPLIAQVGIGDNWAEAK